MTNSSTKPGFLFDFRGSGSREPGAWGTPGAARASGQASGRDGAGAGAGGRGEGAGRYAVTASASISTSISSRGSPVKTVVREGRTPDAHRGATYAPYASFIAAKSSRVVR